MDTLSTVQTADPRVLIVGGGIGGLTAAIALRRAGINATVVERLHDLRSAQTGQGIAVWCNAMHALAEIGLADQVKAAGPTVQRLEFRSWQGAPLAIWPIAEVGRTVGQPSVSVSREDMLSILGAAVGDGVIRFGAEVSGFTQDSQGVTVRFTDGHDERADVVIGAGGLHSVMRRQLLGPKAPRYAGYAVWQAIIDFDHEASEVGVDRLVWGRGARFAFHYVGGDRLFWMAIVNASEDQTEVGSGAKHALLERYRGWMAPVEAVIEATPEAALRMVRIYDREPADRWGEGRVTLLGDAAHPMTNNLGQGACQAIEDGVVLARCLSGRRDVVAALRSYEAQRMPRTARIQRAARTVGSIGRWSNPLVCAVRDQAIKRLFDGYVLRQNNAILTGTV